jgi:hypothetical protein
MREAHDPRIPEATVDGTSRGAALAEDRSPPELDAAILAAARRAVEADRTSGSRGRFRVLAGRSGPVLGAFALGLLAGFALHGLLGEASLSGPADAAAGTSNAVTAPEVTASPARWLHAIAALVRQGRLSEADGELAAFQRRYPDYSRGAAP